VAVDMAVLRSFRKLVFDTNFKGRFINNLLHSPFDEIKDRWHRRCAPRYINC
jgi:hypothetical protein